jgi:hypothetical protein
MTLELKPEGLCLNKRQLLKLRGGAGHAVVCHSGSVWLTQDGDRRDIVLGAGESFALDRAGLVLVQALEQSAISIAAPSCTTQALAPVSLSRRAAGIASPAHNVAGA